MSASLSPHAEIDLVVQGPALSREAISGISALAKTCGEESLRAAHTPAVRLLAPQTREGVLEACAERGLDAAFVPRDRSRSRVSVLAMDMDSTLITIECIDEIADMLGIKPQVSAITASAMRGEIDFRRSLVRRAALLAGLPVEALEHVYEERLRLSPGAERMLHGFEDAGAKTVLVSGGFTYFTDRLKARVGLDYTLSNVLEIEDGRLTGRIVGDIVDAQAKAAEVARLAALHSKPGALLVAIGDGANDLPLFAVADVSVAYHAKPAVREAATHAIDHCGLDAVLNLFN